MTIRRRMVAGNWKMHGSQALVKNMLTALAALPTQDQVEIAIFPPYIYLPELQQQDQLHYGAQNCSMHEQGAFTGEISAAMLAEFNCKYVILGHSERRALYGETSSIVAKKMEMALKQGLIPIICIGETAEERENNATLEVLKQQLMPVLELTESQQIPPKWVLAYEPIWAIGTGKTATPELAQQTHSQIRQFLAQYSPVLAEHLTLLYGGSVKADNAEQLGKQPDIDGFLVGGAALDPAQFLSICQAAIKGNILCKYF